MAMTSLFVWAPGLTLILYILSFQSDAQGRPIRKLIDGQMSQGQHSFTFDGSELASGIYYYTIYANGELLTKRMMKL